MGVEAPLLRGHLLLMVLGLAVVANGRIRRMFGGYAPRRISGTDACECRVNAPCEADTGNPFLRRHYKFALSAGVECIVVGLGDHTSVVADRLSAVP